MDGLKVDVQKLKIGQAELQKNIVENLGEFTEKIAHQAEDRTYVLNRRLFDVETMIHKIDKLDISILLYYRVNPMPIKKNSRCIVFDITTMNAFINRIQHAI